MGNSQTADSLFIIDESNGQSNSRKESLDKLSNSNNSTIGNTSFNNNSIQNKLSNCSFSTSQNNSYRNNTSENEEEEIEDGCEYEEYFDYDNEGCSKEDLVHKIQEYNISNNCDYVNQKRKTLTELQGEICKEDLERIKLLSSDSLEDNKNIWKREISINSEIQDQQKQDYSISETNNKSALNFHNLSLEKTRKSYISKLLSSGLLSISESELKKRKNVHNSIIIFDWDDTLLCTSFLTPNGEFDPKMLLTENERKKLSELESNVFQLLKKSIEVSNYVFIITNSVPGWVNYSVNKFFPNIQKSGIMNNIKVIYPRLMYEKIYPNDANIWKNKAFVDIIKNLNLNLVTNILCIGDSNVEINAGKNMANNFLCSFIKSVKLIENPKPEELNKQICVLNNKFYFLFNQAKNLNFYFEK